MGYRCANTGRRHPSHYVLKLEIVEADDRVDEAVNVVAGDSGPLEAIAVEHLCGVVVIGFDPAHLMGVAQVVGHEWTQQGDQVGIVHHPFKGFLEFLFLHTFQGDAGVGKAIQDIGKIGVVDVIGMEHGALLGGGGQQHDGFFINWMLSFSQGKVSIFFAKRPIP